ncbi:MAG: NTP transferase domain-containing protein [Chitinophagaceae bacterium]|nr:NTP transferase domain-containing protein [Chitinophagaceae bacterium]
MEEDKCFLNYHGKAQCYHVYEMLEKFCADVFISCTARQSFLIDAAYKTLPDLDAYAHRGPAAGVLTAFSKYPSNNFLVIGCDYPFLAHTEINGFLKNVPRNALAAAFFDEHSQCYQPILAWYSSEAGVLLQKSGSLKELLEDVNAFKHIPVDPNSIRSVDTKQESVEVMHTINFNY